MPSRKEVYLAIDSERQYQKDLETSNDSIGDHLTVLRIYMNRADNAFLYDSGENVMDFIRKIAGVAVAAMEDFGAPKRKD